MGGRFFPPETLDHRRPQRSNLALFDSMRQYGLGDLALAPQLRGPVIARARELFLTAVRPFEGHAAQATLGFYRTRTARGISSYPGALLGDRAEVFAPGASDAVAVAAIAAKAEAKSGDRLYAAAFDRLNARVGRLPSTSDTPRRAPRLARRWRSEPAIEMHRRLLSQGPLAPYVSAELTTWLEAPVGRELSGDLRLGMEALSLLHSWCDRYRPQLREIDPADLLC
jgi:hypothetical protein